MQSSVRGQRFLLLRPLFHLVVIVLVYWAMILLRGYTDLIPFVQLKIPTIDRSETMIFALLSGLLFVCIGISQQLYGLFRPTPQGYTNFLSTRVMRVILSGFCAWVGFGYLFTSGISRFVLLVASGVSLFFLLLVDYLWTKGAEWRGEKFVYRLALSSEQAMHAEQIAYEFKGHEEYSVVPTSLDNLIDTVDDRDGCVIVGAVDHVRLNEVNEYCRIMGKDLYQLAEGHFFEDSFGVPMSVGPLVVTAWRSSPLMGWRRVVKRFGDILISSVVLLVLSPVFLLIALLIKRDSPGPVFYRQERIGRQKKGFSFVKFRSMYTHLSTGEQYGGAEAEYMYEQLIASKQNVREGILPKIAHDPRVTRLGVRLRKTSLDELPSLRSVLVGDMSLVGPRPHLPREVAQYAPRHQRLFSVKPGITGYAQLHGRDKVPFDEEAKLDLWYIHHRSLWLDLYVLVATIKVIFSGK